MSLVHFNKVIVIGKKKYKRGATLCLFSIEIEKEEDYTQMEVVIENKFHFKEEYDL
jgi:hypothetical protein